MTVLRTCNCCGGSGQQWTPVYIDLKYTEREWGWAYCGAYQDGRLAIGIGEVWCASNDKLHKALSEVAKILPRGSFGHVETG